MASTRSAPVCNNDGVNAHGVHHRARGIQADLAGAGHPQHAVVVAKYDVVAGFHGGLFYNPNGIAGFVDG